MVRRALVGAVVALASAAGAAAGGPTDLYNAGEPKEVAQRTESVYWLDGRDLRGGTTYQATSFPLKITFRATDALWNGVQARSGRFRFIQLTHKYAFNAQGKVAVWGHGLMTLEAGVGKTGSVRATVSRLHSTARIEAGPLTGVRIGGFRGMSFDAEVVGTEAGEEGIPFIPFTRDARPGGDHKFVRKGERLRIIVIGVRGKTVVVYLESVDERPERSFPVFTRIANRLLSTMTFPR